MRPRCWLGWHRAPNPYFAVHNDGMWFGECPGCYETIVKPDHAGWRDVPEGYRVQWKDGRPTLVVGKARTARPVGRMQRSVRNMLSRPARKLLALEDHSAKPDEISPR